MNGHDIAYVLNSHRDHGKTLLMKNATTVLLRLATALAGMALLGACQPEQLPIGAQLSMSPPERSITVQDRTNENGSCPFDPDYHTDQPIVLALTDGQGSPIGDAEVSVYVDWAENTFVGLPALALYDDHDGNSNGVVDDDELVSGSGDSIARVSTGRYGGDRALLLRINLSCPFRGEVFAFVDGVTASASIEVVAEREDDPVALDTGADR